VRNRFRARALKAHDFLHRVNDKRRNPMSMRYIGLVPLTLAAGFVAAACGGSSESAGDGSKKSGGETCWVDAECQSGHCDKGMCTGGSAGPGDDKGGPKGGGGTSGSGTGGTTGGTATGSGGSSGNGGSAAGSSGPPLFPGPVSAEPLAPGCGPDTATECGGACAAAGGSSGPTTVVRPPVALCFSGAEDPTPANPTAVIEQVIETIDGVSMVHLRITFDPSFVDNTYGVNASSGWGAPAVDGMKGKGGHTFGDLVGSDHLELLLTDGSGATVMDFKIDYVSVSADAPCGYGSLGVSGGEGKVLSGDASAVLAVVTSLDRNLNGCGYCYTEDSPATDDLYAANPDTPDWDYRVIYEVWLALDAFGDAGFGQAYIQNVHASPSKLDTNTVEVSASPCPPGWDTPFCPPELVQEDGSCSGDTGTCPPNYEIYVMTEGQEICTPIPFGGYPGMTPCPEGYALDPATEGRYCLPVE
jgi:hypothetical protein